MRSQRPRSERCKQPGPCTRLSEVPRIGACGGRGGAGESTVAFAAWDQSGVPYLQADDAHLPAHRYRGLDPSMGNHRQAMEEALARHDRLVSQVVADHGGRMVKAKGEGDSSFSVFTSPAQAVAAALELQRALAAEPWPLPAPLAVRVAVHAGEVQERGADFYGPVVNRCARLRAIGHGGQVLLSAVLAELVQENLPQGAYLRDLGVHRLKDLAAPSASSSCPIPSCERSSPAELAGGPTEQPPPAADQLHRARQPAGRAAPTAGGAPAGHPDRDRRLRQDPAGLAGQCRRPRRLLRWGVAGGAGAAVRALAGRASAGHGPGDPGSHRHRRPDLNRSPGRPPGFPPYPGAVGQLRAPGGGLCWAGRRAGQRLPRPDGAGHLPRATRRRWGGDLWRPSPGRGFAGSGRHRQHRGCAVVCRPGATG